MISAEELVLNQSVLVGVEDDVEAHVAIDMEGELESPGCVGRQHLVQLSAGAVHHPLSPGPSGICASPSSSFRDRLQGVSPTYVTEATFWALGPQPCRLPAVPMQPLCPW